MSLLLIEIPPRARLLASGQTATAPADGEWSYVLSHDGRSATRSGSAAASLLPRADQVVAVLSPADVAWHHVQVPRVSASRLRPALAGLLEEVVLDDTDALHFAIMAKADPGEPTWVAVAHKAWLASVLDKLEAAGIAVDRVAPALTPALRPGAPTIGQFRLDDVDPEHQPALLSLAHAQGVWQMKLAGGLARHQLGALGTISWSTTPAAAAAAERWLGSPVPVQAHADRLLTAAQNRCNLRQFDLAQRHRGMRWLREAGRTLMSPPWRALRWGIGALAALQLIGLNAHAWQQGRQIAAKRQAMTELLKTAHPQVRTVLDAPLQMKRETEALRAAAGRLGDTDLESLVGATAAAWPDGTPPAQSLRYENGKLTLSAPGVGAARAATMRERLRASGLEVEAAEGRVTIARGGSGGGRT